METTQLGRTALKVSRICLGTMNFGPRTSEADAHAIMDRALADGINFFDTANVYGTRGGTEEIVGRWLAGAPGRRDQVVLATKVYGQMGDGPNDRGLSARHIRQACEASLRRLQTDYIDLYQMHHIDRSAPWDEVWQAMELLVAQGKVLYVGSSNFAGWHIAEAQATASARHFLGLVSEQSLYNLADRTVELEVLPACERFGLGVIPWSPLAGGILGGVLATDAASGSGGARRFGDQARERVERLRPQLERWEGFCRELGQAPGEVALAWLLHQPAVSAPIVGPRTMDQLLSAEHAAAIRLDDKALATLDEIWPGPGGPAPEVYAW